MRNELIYALEEEIGNPKVFIGREKELSFFLNWCENVKHKQSQSTAILARRKKGKTALVQRLYNILFTKNDPILIPFYFRVEEGNMTLLDYSSQFYRSLVGQYLAFKKRDVILINNYHGFEELLEYAATDNVLAKDIRYMQQVMEQEKPGEAWQYARMAGHRISSLKDERIIQILDEFQFLNVNIYTDETYEKRIDLVPFYHRMAESKISPQLVTGSYIGWLTSIIRKLVSRYREYYLEGFPDEEAIDAVYNYSTLLKQPITDETAPLIAGICYNDPYYIAQVMMSNYPSKNLTNPESVLATLQFETTLPGGQIAKMWLEYIWEAFDKVNDRNAKAIVLYLAKHGHTEKTREQILKDLKLNMGEGDLEAKLQKLVKADILAQGKSNFDYRGLGDKIFEIVFRRIYEKEIERVDNEEIEADIRKEMESLRGQISYYKGVSSEYRVINKLTFALYQGKKLNDIVKDAIPGLIFGPFSAMEKKSFHLDQEKRLEVDIFCQSAEPDGVDFIIEIKDWQKEVSEAAVESCIGKKRILTPYLRKRTGFILYCENGIRPDLEERLRENEIMVSSRDCLN